MIQPTSDVLILCWKYPPEEQQRIRIMKKSCNTQHFDDDWLGHISKTVVLSPSEGQRIAKVVALANSADKSQTHAEQLIQHSYQATTRKVLDFSVKPVTKPASSYQLEWLNTQSNIEQIVAAAKASKQGRICLYGPPGCGKTQFAHYLAEQAEMPIISKKASDMIRPYVGETEMSIAQAFKEASDQNALLLIDEADSFFMNRHSARESWEVTRVNELLVQLEQFDGLFVAATNLLDNFDSASKRRFDFKVEFDYLTSKQSFDLYCSTLHEKPLPDALARWRRAARAPRRARGRSWSRRPTRRRGCHPGAPRSGPLPSAPPGVWRDGDATNSSPDGAKAITRAARRSAYLRMQKPVGSPA